jgi:hypothetical protein
MREYFLTILLIAGAAIGAGFVAYSIIGARSGEVLVAFSATDELPESITEALLSVSDIALVDEEGEVYTVSADSISHSLSDFSSRGTAILLARSRIPDGTYPGLRITIDSLTLTDTNGSINDAVLPTHVYDVPAKSVVKRGKTTTILLDFSAERSLRQTVDGLWVALPVVRTELRSEAAADGVVGNIPTIAGGTITANATFGANPEGVMRENFALPRTMRLGIDNGMIVVIENENAPSVAPTPFELEETLPSATQNASETVELE